MTAQPEQGKRAGRFSARLALALAGARLVSQTTRMLGRGGGTALPGLVAERIDPRALGKLGARFRGDALVIGGTNGKTTTAHMVATILGQANRRVVHNRAGSNLVRGVLAALSANSSLAGQPRGDTAVIEADEAALPAIVEGLRPRLLLFNNLFRDQLDRYGELDHIARRWRAAVDRLDERTTLLVNADDPMLAGVVEGARARVRYFGVTLPESSPLLLATLPHAADAAICGRCGGRLAYHQLYLSHLGNWHCPRCGHARPQLAVTARDVTLHGLTSLSLTIAVEDENPAAGPADAPARFAVEAPLPGFYNAYNTLAAVTAGLAFGAEPATIASALGRFTGAFGRVERIEVQGRELVLMLVKNPTGFNEVLRMLVDADSTVRTAPILLVINDLDADGRDVSWLWDVDFELLTSDSSPLHTAGLRGPDMAVRLKYAGVDTARVTSHDPDDLRAALVRFIEAAPPDGTLYVLPTYTAMLEIRRFLTGMGVAREFWHS